MSNEVFDDCLESLLTCIEQKVTFANIINIITRAIEIVECCSKLKGPEKKEMVVRLVITLIDRYEDDADLKKSLIDMCNSIGGNVIDIIIFASKGKLAINLKKKCVSKFSCLT